MTKHVAIPRRCDEIGGQFFLRAQLTLECDGKRRKVHVLLAILMTLLYPIGVPLLIFGLMYPNRHRIKTLMQAVDEVGAVARTGRLTRQESLENLQFQLQWLTDKFDNFKPARWWMGIFVLVSK